MKKILSVLFIGLFLMAFVSLGQAATGNFEWTFGTDTDTTAVTNIYFSIASPVSSGGTLLITTSPGATTATAVSVPGATTCGIPYYFAITVTAYGFTSPISDTVSSSYACVSPGKPILSPVILFK